MARPAGSWGIGTVKWRIEPSREGGIPFEEMIRMLISSRLTFLTRAIAEAVTIWRSRLSFTVLGPALETFTPGAPDAPAMLARLENPISPVPLTLATVPEL